MVPFTVTAPVARSTVPLGTISVAPTFTVIVVNWKLVLPGSDSTTASDARFTTPFTFNAPADPSP
jgi:hypothetical protein